MKAQTKITDPVLTLRNRYGTLAIWAGNPGQLIEVSKCSCHIFPVSKTASLVYEDRPVNACGMHRAEENEINSPKIWEWIEKYMERGMIAEGHMQIENSKHWELEKGKIVAKEPTRNV